MAPPMTHAALQAQDASSRADPILIEGWTLYALGICVVLVRLLARYKMVGIEGSKPDDWLMILAMIVYGIESAMSHLVSLYGGNSNLTPEQREGMSEEEVERRVFGSKMFMIGWFAYSGAMWVLKLCMVFFFSRITVGLRRQVWITGAYVIVGFSYLIICLVLFLTCRPWHKLWQVRPDPGPNCSIESPVYYLTILSFNVATDAFLISLPLPLLIRSSIPWRRKAILVLLFSAGVFVVVAAILRCVFSLTNPQNSRTVSAWACRETFVAVVVGNAPMIRTLRFKIPWPRASSSSGAGIARTGKASSRLNLAKGSSSGDDTWEIRRETEWKVETADRENLENNHQPGIEGLDFPVGCSYAATCEFFNTSSASSDRAVSVEKGEDLTSGQGR